MATNQTGIAIVIKAFLPTGKTLDETYAALTVVKTAHETGDYAPLLSIAKIDEVKTEQKTRRVEEAVTPLAERDPDFDEIEGVETAEEVLAQDENGTDDVADAEDIPAFLKSKKSAKAA
ncbi:hypothetical protein [Aminobacter ciceronei]|uniref:Uncharacterized protein n=1 Tax=Aminobacter ciceronei TaxID=150723 RepID=A0ABR6C1B7_9HYPH|nr:hypothetical protein [Aminobacter ciceronei]MBA8904885.1 hypothetical protein [Aminobacter ciceronei]MBA9018561.1 hypothetical protein [Aminobacter ciceronei]